MAGNKIGNLGIGMAFGLVLLAMVYAIGPISGCRINPAVTLGVLLARKIGPVDAALYTAAQLVGAVVSAGVLLILVKAVPGGYDPGISGLGANG